MIIGHIKANTGGTIIPPSAFGQTSLSASLAELKELMEIAERENLSRERMIFALDLISDNVASLYYIHTAVTVDGAIAGPSGSGLAENLRQMILALGQECLQLESQLYAIQHTSPEVYRQALDLLGQFQEKYKTLIGD